MGRCRTYTHTSLTDFILPISKHTSVDRFVPITLETMNELLNSLGFVPIYLSINLVISISHTLFTLLFNSMLVITHEPTTTLQWHCVNKANTMKLYDSQPSINQSQYLSIYLSLVFNDIDSISWKRSTTREAMCSNRLSTSNMFH